MAVESLRSTVQNPKASGVVVSKPLQWHQRLAAALLYGLIRAVAATVRYEWQDRSGVLNSAKTQPVIFCIWHNRLALSLQVKVVYLRKIGRPCPLAAIVSASKDGGILARVLEHFEAQPVRGSTSRRGRQALLESTRWARRGYDIAITPDGPRGPRYVIQDGVAYLAQLTGLPIVPVSYYLSWKVRLKSWDRFQIPLPFTRCVMKFGEPVRVPREASEAERETVRLDLENRMKALTED